MLALGTLKSSFGVRSPCQHVVFSALGDAHQHPPCCCQHHQRVCTFRLASAASRAAESGAGVSKADVASSSRPAHEAAKNGNNGLEPADVCATTRQSSAGSAHSNASDSRHVAFSAAVESDRASSVATASTDGGDAYVPFSVWASGQLLGCEVQLFPGMCHALWHSCMMQP